MVISVEGLQTFDTAVNTIRAVRERIPERKKDPTSQTRKSMLLRNVAVIEKMNEYLQFAKPNR